MQKKVYGFMMVSLVFLLIGGCGGPIRYSQVSPDAPAFHPESIAVLSVVTDGFPEAKGKGEGILARALTKKKWFKKVVQPEQLNALMEKDGALKTDITDYLDKLQTVSFSDPDISKRIGDALGVQAFVVGRVDLWHYVEESEKKQAKVGLELRLINAETGKVVWRANHNRIEDYLLLKPGLSGMAENLADDMIVHMPR